MPPTGIDRFNFVVADRTLQIQGGTLHAWDAGGTVAAWDGHAAPAVAGGHTGVWSPPDQFPAAHVRIVLDMTYGGTPQQFVFEKQLLGGNATFWVGQVTVGFYRTPRGRGDFEPFGLLEIVDPADTHLVLPLSRGADINP